MCMWVCNFRPVYNELCKKWLPIWNLDTGQVSLSFRSFCRHTRSCQHLTVKDCKFFSNQDFLNFPDKISWDSLEINDTLATIQIHTAILTCRSQVRVPWGVLLSWLWQWRPIVPTKSPFQHHENHWFAASAVISHHTPASSYVYVVLLQNVASLNVNVT